MEYYPALPCLPPTPFCVQPCVAHGQTCSHLAGPRWRTNSETGDQAGLLDHIPRPTVKRVIWPGLSFVRRTGRTLGRVARFPKEERLVWAG